MIEGEVMIDGEVMIEGEVMSEKKEPGAVPEFVGPQYVAEYFRVSVQTARTWMKSGAFGEPFRPNKRTLLVPREVVEIQRTKRIAAAMRDES